MFKEEVIQICSNISIVQEILLQTGTYRIKRMVFFLKLREMWQYVRGGKCYLEKLGSQKILAGSRNLGSVFDKSRNLVFAWFVFTFFESRKFLPKSLRLRFLTRISASRRVSDFTICHPLCYCVLKIASVTQNLFWEISVSLKAFYHLSLGDQVVKPKMIFSLGL